MESQRFSHAISKTVSGNCLKVRRIFFGGWPLIPERSGGSFGGIW
jgi:hypothetical protein